VDDIAEGVVRAMDHVATPNARWNGADPDPATSRAPYRLYNIGSNRPIELLRYIEVLEQCLGARAERILRPLQSGDVPDTHADVTDLVAAVDYAPGTPIEVGVRNFVTWYREYYKC
jgi:UDP-glucuronate 4-epimerase